MSTPQHSPQQRVHDATRRLIDLLQTGEITTPEAVELRIELAEATAAAGHVEDAFYQADELRKDVRREHGPDHPGVARAYAVMIDIEERAHAAAGRREEPEPSQQSEQADRPEQCA